MNGRPTTVERAYQIARSGEAANVKDIKNRMRTEGFGDVAAQLSGPTITAALRRLCVAARAKPEVENAG
ncbi:MAG TPA: hypothetical protein VII63_03415 [Caulobacteraceae bacterium]